MEWLAENWIFAALAGGMVAMHLIGHRRGGGHGHGENGCGKKKPNEEQERSE